VQAHNICCVSALINLSFAVKGMQNRVFVFMKCLNVVIKITFLLLFLLYPLSSCLLNAEESFSFYPEIFETNGAKQLWMKVKIEKGYYLYADNLKITVEPDVLGEQLLAGKPVPEKGPDNEVVNVYENEQLFVFNLTITNELPHLKVFVSYQGCSEKVCFVPKKVEYVIDLLATGAVGHVVVDKASDLKKGDLNDFIIAGRASGYMNSEEFIAFIEKVETTGYADIVAENSARLADKNALLFLLFILLGGIGLNFTPCVLPMIPVNLAIIGASTKERNFLRGFLAGAIYGLGIAISYGMLGLIVIFTGLQFGALNSSPLFNFIISALFVLLALAMFDLFHIDFSRWQSRVNLSGNSTRNILFPFVMGCISAVLAGACVAPVVLSVLLLSADFYMRGYAIALLLPFLLGLGMALPWPLAGAGLSFLPRPGKWMEYTKYIFGVLILGIAFWYAFTGYKLLVGIKNYAKENDVWIDSLPDALKMAEKTSKPVIIDFWANWCSSCMEMERTTLRDPQVIKKLGNYIRVKFNVDNLKDPYVGKILKEANVRGFPSYLILRKKE